MVRSISGPSGRTEGPRFVIDEPRNRFVYPQDKSFVVYFEWDAPPGQHTLTALWKQPDGRVASISPDVRVDTANRELKCYWTYILAIGMQGGVWTVEIRIDGQPAGSHSFELLGTDQPQLSTQAPAPKSSPKPTLDEIYRSVTRSLVWVYKLDDGGRREDTASGFVVGKNQIATAFQAIDSTLKVQVEFAGGRIESADEVLAFSRLGDWAVLKVETGDAPALELGDPATIAVGERLIACNVEAGGRIIGGVDVGGWRNVAGFGARIQFYPYLPNEAAGGPLLSASGRVLGIVGGSMTPGARIGKRALQVSSSVWNSSPQAAVPVSVVPRQLPAAGRKLTELESQGVLTPPIRPVEEFLYGGTALYLPKDPGQGLPTVVSEFSRKDPQIWIYSLWQQKGKRSKGMASAKIYDENSRLRGEIQPKKAVSLTQVPSRLGFSFVPGPLNPGVYRIDLCWGGQAVWRTFVKISE